MISFSAVTAYWTAKIFILYTVLVLALPYLVLRKFLKGKSFTQKFIICVVFGNFFYITLVLLWGLFHITNRYVLALSTLLIPAAMVFRIRREIWERYLRRVWVCLCQKGEQPAVYHKESFSQPAETFPESDEKDADISGCQSSGTDLVFRLQPAYHMVFQQQRIFWPEAFRSVRAYVLDQSDG